MCHQTGVDKIYLYVKDPYEAIKLSLNIWMMFELFLEDGKLNISLVFITHTYFAVPKKIS